MDKIYIVTSGEYSDYGIFSVHKTKEEAEKAVKLCDLRSNYSKARIETYDIGVTPSTLEEEAINRGMKFFACYCDKDNQKIDCYDTDSDDLVNDFMEVGEKKSYFYIKLMARDENHAKKIFLDELTMYMHQSGLSNG